MDSHTKIGIENSEDSWLQIPIPTTGSDHNDSSSSPPVTPKSEKIPVALSFGSGSSSDDVTPPNRDSDSSYSELDSEAEAFYSSLNHHLVSPELGSEKQMSYGELLKRFVQCEEELKSTSLKLRDSEQEIEKLKGEAEKREYAVLLAEDLRVELETARREIEMKNTEIEAEKTRGVELERQVVDLETKVRNREDELELERYSSDCLLEKQNFFKERVVEVTSHSEILEGQIWQSDADIKALKTDLASRDEQIEILNKAFDEHKLRYDMLMAEKDGVRSEVDSLKAEMRSKDIQIEQIKDMASRDEKIEALNKAFDEHKLSYDMLRAEKDGVCAEVDKLKAEMRSRDIQIEQMKDTVSRNEQIEALNKVFDEHKLSYDMLMVEKDGVTAEVHMLKAEMRSRDIQIEQMKEKINQMVSKQTELVSESGTAKKTAEELKSMISKAEEEKREAIRQLCFSLDHYKTGYREVLRSLSNLNKQQKASIIV